ncbi:hypothetical protein OUZ56_000907 [Daphnia magna]|uniref:Uncharacterized protein n=1 Tax=Daphnia magna TaxID=35525 RepID=A0ABR0A141_9CRUS|nr:hypothetical protein OUZ56_000907 [Daphnia magna]
MSFTKKEQLGNNEKPKDNYPRLCWQTTTPVLRNWLKDGAEYLDLAFRFFQLGLRETVSKGRDRHPYIPIELITDSPYQELSIYIISAEAVYFSNKEILSKTYLRNVMK